MPRGGKRAGAGRKKRSLDKHTLAVAELGQLTVSKIGHGLLTNALHMATTAKSANLRAKLTMELMPYFVGTRKPVEGPHPFEPAVAQGEGPPLARLPAAQAQLPLGELPVFEEVEGDGSNG